MSQAEYHPLLLVIGDVYAFLTVKPANQNLEEAALSSSCKIEEGRLSAKTLGLDTQYRSVHFSDRVRTRMRAIRPEVLEHQHCNHVGLWDSSVIPNLTGIPYTGILLT
jgi:hypothetical protein